jgi:hypothetical protein
MTPNDEVTANFPIKKSVIDSHANFCGTVPLRIHVTPQSNKDPANDHRLPILFIAI